MRYLTIFLLFAQAAFYGQTRTVLFLGNSYTAANSLPQLTSSIALSFGDTLIWDNNNPGGYTFELHSTNANSLSKINAASWDFVVLQEQSQIPSFPPSQVASDCFPYASILVDSIKSANPCAEPVFFMTWGRENGDQNNCVNYPPLCTYGGMQARLRESYIQMSQDNLCTVSPVGAAWKYVRDNHPSIGLYSNDGSHPSIYGSYLAACVHYATLFKESPVGSPFTSTIGNADALALQQAASLIVLDSLENWRIDANLSQSSFTYQLNGNSATFDFTGSNSFFFDWDFGDSNYSNDENPTHEYLNNGTYYISLITSNNCSADTTIESITISSLGLNENLSFDFIQHPDFLKINFKTSAKRVLSLVDLQGRLLYKKISSDNQLQIPIDHNKMYIFSVNEGGKAKNIKFFNP